jgi:MAGE family
MPRVSRSRKQTVRDDDDDDGNDDEVEQQQEEEEENEEVEMQDEEDEELQADNDEEEEEEEEERPRSRKASRKAASSKKKSSRFKKVVAEDNDNDDDEEEEEEEEEEEQENRGSNRQEQKQKKQQKKKSQQKKPRTSVTAALADADDDEEDDDGSDGGNGGGMQFLSQMPDQSQDLPTARTSDRNNLMKLGHDARTKAISDLVRTILNKALAGEPIHRQNIIKEAQISNSSRISSAAFEEANIVLQNTFDFKLVRVPAWMERTKDLPAKCKERYYLINSLEDDPTGQIWYVSLFIVACMYPTF